MQHDIPVLNRKELRRFGLITGAIVAGLFGLLVPWLRGHGFSKWPLVIAGVLWGWAIAAPGTLNPVYYGWMRFGLVMGFINTRIILGLIFYGLMGPMGFVMKLLGYDPLRRSFEATAETYRAPVQPRVTPSMENPY